MRFLFDEHIPPPIARAVAAAEQARPRTCYEVPFGQKTKDLKPVRVG